MLSLTRNVARIARFNQIRKLSTIPQYDLTCGLEIHAQLQTKQKLFSRMFNEINMDYQNVNEL